METSRTQKGAEALLHGAGADARPGRRILPAAWLAGAVGMILCVGVADFLTGTDTSLILFYLAPIGFGTWFVSLRGGVFLSFASAAVSFGADALHWASGPGIDHVLPVLVWNALMQLGTAAALVLVLAALRARLEAQEQLARTDALTRISNRRAFFEAVALEIERARRSGRPLTLAYVDCDDFKNVNDRMGHAQGDALLVTVARTLLDNVRTVDAVARLGGDEFGVLLPETDGAEAEALLARVHSTLLETMAAHGWPLGFSAGAATFLGPPASADEMMACADALMYAAKREAKGSMRLATYAGGPCAPDRGTAAPAER